MSYVYRKAKKYIINLLELFAFSNYYTWFSIVLFVSTWTPLFGVLAAYINSFIILTWFAGWLYENYKLIEENEKLKQINNVLTYRTTKDIKQELAALMHDFWAEDILQTDFTDEEEYRATRHYTELSYEDQQVNLAC